MLTNSRGNESSPLTCIDPSHPTQVPSTVATDVASFHPSVTVLLELTRNTIHNISVVYLFEWRIPQDCRLQAISQGGQRSTNAPRHLMLLLRTEGAVLRFSSRSISSFEDINSSQKHSASCSLASDYVQNQSRKWDTTHKTDCHIESRGSNCLALAAHSASMWNPCCQADWWHRDVDSRPIQQNRATESNRV